MSSGWKKSIAYIAAAGLALGAVNAQGGDSTAKQWSGHGGDAANSSRYAGTLGNDFDVAWKTRVGCPAEGVGGLAVGGGLVFGVSPCNGKGDVHAVDQKTGAVVWEYRVGGKNKGVTNTPTYHDGVLYIQVNDQLMAFDADPRDDGKDEGLADAESDRGEGYDVIWSVGTAGRVETSSPKVFGDWVFFNDGKGLHVYDRAGDGQGSTTLLASLTTGGGTHSTPAIADGIVVIGSDTGVHAWKTGDWSESWVFATPERVSSSPAIDSNGRVYVGCDNGMLYCLSLESGGKVWEADTQCGPVNSPALADGLVFIGSFNGCGVHALEADSGQKAWFYEVPDRASAPEGKSPEAGFLGGVMGTPVAADGKLVFNSYAGFLYVISTSRELAEGQDRLLYKFEGPRQSSPAVADGSIYLRYRPSSGAEDLRLDPK